MKFDELFEQRSLAGEKLKQYLNSNGYTKVSFSKWANISRPTLDKLINGTIDNKTTFDKHFQKILSLFNISVEDFMSYTFTFARKYNHADNRDLFDAYKFDSDEPEVNIVCEDAPDYEMTSGSVAYDLSSNSGHTIEDYLALPDDIRVELIDGVFYDMSAPAFIHQRIAGLIHTVFENFIDSNHGMCIPMMAPSDVQLDCDDKTMVQPDVFVICDRDKIIGPRVVGAPDLVIEILSPSNWFHDVVRKLKKYRNAGVKEYWIVMPESKKVMVYFFENSADPIEYSFNDTIPVNIWDGKCKVNFKTIYNKISFLMK